MSKGCKAGQRLVAVGGRNQAKWPSCGVGRWRGVGELTSGVEGNDFGRARHCGIRDD